MVQKVKSTGPWTYMNIFLKAYIKMDTKINFVDIEIQNQKFDQHKSPVWINNIDIKNSSI